jgi:hypothetical protein
VSWLVLLARLGQAKNIQLRRHKRAGSGSGRTLGATTKARREPFPASRLFAAWVKSAGVVCDGWRVIFGLG